MKHRRKLICLMLSVLILFSACGIEIVTEDDMTESNITEDDAVCDSITEDATTNDEVDTADDSDSLEVIVYEGNLYCGLGGNWKIESLPDDFEQIGTFQGALTEEKGELTSTMVFETGDAVYHYTDSKGKHYFCVKYKKADYYIGIYGARIYNTLDNVNVSEAHEIVDYRPIIEDE